MSAWIWLLWVTVLGLLAVIGFLDVTWALVAWAYGDRRRAATAAALASQEAAIAAILHPPRSAP